MSRYPGSQFIVVDNTNTTASVPITTKNSAAPTYETVFRAPKGPEEITTTYGTEFYDLYGSQSKMLFSKYGQPLLQASMDINAGAQLIAKRAVLQNACLANSTVGIVLSKVKPVTVTCDENGLITAATLDTGDDSDPTFQMRPVVVSLKDALVVNPIPEESKQYYGLHKDYLTNLVLTEDDFAVQTGVKVTGTYTAIGESTPTKTFSFNLDNTTDGANVLNNGFAADTFTWDASGTITVGASNADTLKSIYAASVKEYFFPLFTIFDNGRGASTKSIQLLFDTNSSKTLGKAIYTLKVFDWESNKVLETFAFTIDPYTRNNKTGYTFDIESAVNLKSKQIKAKMHYDSYEKLVATLADEVYTDENVFIASDCLFGYNLNGTYNSGLIVEGLYAFKNADANNINTTGTTPDQIYYYYDYSRRTNYGLSEKLEFGDDGHFTITTSGQTVTKTAMTAAQILTAYQDAYRDFFNGTFDRDIFNLDIYFHDCVFDANYSDATKVAIQRLSAYRGDFFAYLDMGIGSVKSLADTKAKIQPTSDEADFPVSGTPTKCYVHDMHNAVTSIYGDIKDPYTNKQITVTGTYGLSIVMVNHFITGVGKVFAGKSNGITFGGFIEGTVNYIPKIYPDLTQSISLSNFGNTYPSDDAVIINEKQEMCDLRVNYGSYYGSLFTMDTQYTLNGSDSEFSYINNVMLVNKLIQEIRKACPSARYQFIDGDDLQKYEDAVNVVIKANRSKFASVKFKYLQDENSIANKIFYAAIEVVFRPFAQAEIFTITALNYSTLDSNVTTA